VPNVLGGRSNDTGMAASCDLDSGNREQQPARKRSLRWIAT
jgi:hypothetical protein